MNRDELRRIFLAEIENIAPDADTGQLADDADIRDALDLDSMDFLNLITALSDRLGVMIPEADAGKLVTLSGALGYLSDKV